MTSFAYPYPYPYRSAKLRKLWSRLLSEQAYPSKIPLGGGPKRGGPANRDSELRLNSTLDRSLFGAQMTTRVVGCLQVC